MASWPGLLSTWGLVCLDPTASTTIGIGASLETCLSLRPLGPWSCLDVNHSGKRCGLRDAELSTPIDPQWGRLFVTWAGEEEMVNTT